MKRLYQIGIYKFSPEWLLLVGIGLVSLNGLLANPFDIMKNTIQFATYSDTLVQIGIGLFVNGISANQS